MKVVIEKAANGFIIDTDWGAGKIKMPLDTKILVSTFEEAILEIGGQFRVFNKTETKIEVKPNYSVNKETVGLDGKPETRLEP